jgi:hypothetical protein
MGCQVSSPNSSGDEDKASRRISTPDTQQARPVLDTPQFAVASTDKTKNEFLIAIDRLRKDDKFSHMNFNNSPLVGQKEENWQLLAEALRGNTSLVSLELANVSMKDSHCLILLPALATCVNLRTLNFETNLLSTRGIESVAQMVVAS